MRLLIHVVPLDPADTASSAAALLRDAETVVRWQEEEQPDWTEDPGDVPTRRRAAVSRATGSADDIPTSADDIPTFKMPAPLPLPPPLDLPSANAAEPAPPPPAREPPLELSDLHLPLHGMLQLRDGSTQVVDELWTFRAVACLLQIREQQAKILIAAGSGGAISHAAAVVPVDFM